MDWLMFWFWIGIILILAAVLVPNEKYNWGSLLYSVIDNFLAKKEAKKHSDFVTRWRAFWAKEYELEGYYAKKISELNRNIRLHTETLCHLEQDDFRRGVIEETLEEYEKELLKYETEHSEIIRELDIECKELIEERRKLKIKHL